MWKGELLTKKKADVSKARDHDCLVSFEFLDGKYPYIKD